MHKITFYLTESEITRINQMLIDTLGCVDSDTPPGTSVFFRSGELANGYEATLGVRAGKPRYYLDIVLYDPNGVPVAGEQLHADQVCQEFNFYLENGEHYCVEVAPTSAGLKDPYSKN